MDPHFMVNTILIFLHEISNAVWSENIKVAIALYMDLAKICIWIMTITFIKSFKATHDLSETLSILSTSCWKKIKRFQELISGEKDRGG